MGLELNERSIEEWLKDGLDFKLKIIAFILDQTIITRLCLSDAKINF